MNAPWWDVLGIPRDSDRAVKRRAYAAKLKVTNPEDDPAGFMALRQAYEAALTWVDYDWDAEDWDEGEGGDPSPLAPQPSEVPPAPTSLEPPAIGASASATLASLRDSAPQAAPSPSSDPYETARAELRTSIAALEAGLRGPWFRSDEDLRKTLGSILDSAVLIELDTRDRIEFWLADLLADTVPRSDRLLLKAIEAFRWSEEGERPPSVWRILARLDEWQLMHQLNLGEHELSDGWRALTKTDARPWQRRLAALRPTMVTQVQRLFDLVDYQTPGIVHLTDPGAMAWWRAHLAAPRFAFIDLVVMLVALAVLLPIAILVDDAIVRWAGAAAVIGGMAFPFLRVHIVAPWRARRDAQYPPLDWRSHGWVGLWAGAVLLLIWVPVGPWSSGIVALAVMATLWMAVMVGQGPRVTNFVWATIGLVALGIVGGLAFFSMSGAAQAALGAVGIACMIIAGCGAQGLAELLWRVGEKPVLAASAASALLIAAAAVRLMLPFSPVPLIPLGGAAIAGMTLMHSVRDVHDGSFIVRFAPLLRWALWVALVASAILSNPPVEPNSDQPKSGIRWSDFDEGADNPSTFEQGFAALRAGNPALHDAVTKIRAQISRRQLNAEAGARQIARLVNRSYHERLPRAPAALIAAEIDIRLAMLREFRPRDLRACALDENGPELGKNLQQRYFAHALAVAGAPPVSPADQVVGKVMSMPALLRQASDGDTAEARQWQAALTSQPVSREQFALRCDARIALLEALTALPDADIAKTMRPGLIARAAETSAKNAAN